MDFVEVSPKTAAFGGCGCCFVLVAIILGVCSFATLEPEEYGLDYNTLDGTVVGMDGTGKAGDSAYIGGRYPLGLGHTFLTFPREAKDVQFVDGASGALNVRTADGLPVRIEVTFQYQLQIDKIIELYREFGMEYHEQFILVSRDRLQSQATKSSANMYFENRTIIASEMEKDMSALYSERLYSQIIALQLNSVMLPPAYETKIKDMKEMRYKKVLLENELAFAEEVLKKDRDIAKMQVQVDIENAKGAAGKKVVDAQAQTLTTLLDAESLARAVVMDADSSAAATKLDAEQFAQTTAVNANAYFRQTILSAQANAERMQIEAEAKARGILSEQRGKAKAQLAMYQAEANGIDETSRAVSEKQKEYYKLQAEGYKGMWDECNADGDGLSAAQKKKVEEKFLELLAYRKIDTMDWSAMEINLGSMSNPWDLVPVEVKNK